MLVNGGRGRSLRPQVTISMSDLEVLEGVKANFGGMISIKTRKRPGKTMYHWSVKDGAALGLLKAALPYFVITRRRRLAEQVVEVFERWPPKAGDNNDRARRRAAALIEARNRMRTLNSVRLEAPPDLTKVNPGEADYAYFAGILDGEGWIAPHGLCFDVHSTDPELCAWLKSRFGGRVSLAFPAAGNRRPCWRWINRRQEALEVAPKVLQHMRLQRKRKIILKALNVNVPDWLEPLLPATAKEVATATHRSHAYMCTLLRRLQTQGALIEVGRSITQEAGRDAVIFDRVPDNQNGPVEE